MLGDMLLTELPMKITRRKAGELLASEECTGSCLAARDLLCVCRCGGEFHGAGQGKPRIRAQWWPPLDSEGLPIADIDSRWFL